MSHLTLCVQAPLLLLPAQNAPAKASGPLHNAKQPLDLRVSNVLAKLTVAWDTQQLETCPPWLS